MASLKNDLHLFVRLYIGCQMEGGNLQAFIRHENQACPPALSDGRSLRLGTKSDLLKCFENLSDAQSETLATTNIVLDGAVIVQMLKPAAVKNFDEYAQEIFFSSAQTCGGCSSHVGKLTELPPSGLTRRTSSLSSLMERQSSANPLLDLASLAHEEATKKMTIAYCCMQPMQPSMATTR